MLGLLTGAVEHRAHGARHIRRRLQEQRGFADARLTTHQRHGARDNATAQHEVELGEFSGPADQPRLFDIAQAGWRYGGLAGSAAVTALPPSRLPARHDNGFLRNRIPSPTPLASPYPLGMLVAAFGAAVDRLGLSHAARNAQAWADSSRSVWLANRVNCL